MIVEKRTAPRRVSPPVLSLGVIALAVVFGIFHWKYFFPFRAHDDLRFQLAGEIAAFSLSAVTFVYAPWPKRKFKLKDWLAPSEQPGLPSLVAAVIFLTTFQWRDYFLPIGFQGLHLATDLVYVGYFWLLAYFASGIKTGKPSKKEGKSVV